MFNSIINEKKINHIVKKKNIINNKNIKCNLHNINYKNIELLINYIDEVGKILPNTTTDLKIKIQKKISKEIKKARFIGLLPYTDRHYL